MDRKELGAGIVPHARHVICAMLRLPCNEDILVFACRGTDEDAVEVRLGRWGSARMTTLIVAVVEALPVQPVGAGKRRCVP